MSTFNFTSTPPPSFHSSLLLIIIDGLGDVSNMIDLSHQHDHHNHIHNENHQNHNRNQKQKQNYNQCHHPPDNLDCSFTPLQQAHTPVLDQLVAAGRAGMMDPVQPGLACGSDTAHLAILAYPPRLHYQGRGAFEAMGAGIYMSQGDIAFKSNFAYKDFASGIIVSRRADREFAQEGPLLCDALNNCVLPEFPEIQVIVKYASEHRCGVVMTSKNKDLSNHITGTDPLVDGRPHVLCTPTEDHPHALKTAHAVNEMSTVFTNILNDHPINKQRIAQNKYPANVVLFRGCGIRIAVDSFSDLHKFNTIDATNEEIENESNAHIINITHASDTTESTTGATHATENSTHTATNSTKLTGFAIAPTKIIRGLAETVGLDCHDFKGATGDYFTDLQVKRHAAVNLISQHHYNFGLLHIKAVDDAGHDKNLPLKIEFLEKIDTMIGQIIQDLLDIQARSDQRFGIAVTGDHSTPVLYGDHSCEPVPFVISTLSDYQHHSSTMSSDSVPETPSKTTSLNLQSQPRFDEIYCGANGDLGRFPGLELMEIVKAFMKTQCS